MTRKMKDSGVEWIGEIPEEWGVVPTKRVFKSNKKIAGNDAKNYERLALTLNGVIKRSKDDVDGLQPEKFEGYQILKENELVFKLIDLENVKTSRVGLSPFTGLVSPAYIILSNNKPDNRYYQYFYLMMWYNEIFNHLGGDGVRSSLNINDLLFLPLITMNEKIQHKIASFLDTKCSVIDSTIEKEREIIDKLKEYRQAVITEAVTKGIRPGVPMKDSGVEWIGEIPEGWDVFRVKYLLTECEERSLNGNEEPLSMSQKYGLIKSSELDIPNPASSYVGGKLVFEEDLVFNKLKAHLGVFSLSKYTGVVSPDYAVYHGINDTNAKFLEYLFKTAKCISEFKKYIRGVGAGLSRLYTSDLFNIKVAIPQCDEQQLIVQYLDAKCSAIDATIQKRELAIEKLTQYKQSLIYECVTGKKEVMG